MVIYYGFFLLPLQKRRLRRKPIDSALCLCNQFFESYHMAQLLPSKALIGIKILLVPQLQILLLLTESHNSHQMPVRPS